MKIPLNPKIICITDPEFGSRNYPYAFGYVPDTIVRMGLPVCFLNPVTATIEYFKDTIQKFKPDLLFGFIQDRRYIAKIAAFLMEYHPVPATNWSLEDPNSVFGNDGSCSMIESSASFDMWFCNDEKMVPFWRTKAAFMPPGFFDDIFYDAGLERIYDISYIGQLGPKEVTNMYWPYMKEIARYGKKAMLCIDRPMGLPLLPRPFERFLRSKNRRHFLQRFPFWQCQWENPKNEHEKAVIINHSKISFGLNRVRGNWEKNLKSQLPEYPLDKHGLFYQLKGRLFHAVGTGAMALNEYCPELENLFDIGKEIITFEFGDMDDFRDKLKWYVSHDAERKKITLAGYERAHKQHTFTARINQIFEIVRKSL
jgi:spore maturation protein CgeB